MLCIVCCDIVKMPLENFVPADLLVCFIFDLVSVSHLLLNQGPAGSSNRSVGWAATSRDSEGFAGKGR